MKLRQKSMLDEVKKYLHDMLQAIQDIESFIGTELK
jgi:uncharacterized protein with HEPN domain